ncbi:MAG: chromosomal replication initiator protein DnaA [Spirochaetales bacterium]|nr:chromosomal replication initiator protein DnaA [Spirochaetales bacterium]
MNHSLLWKNVLSLVARSIDAHRFETFFRPLSVIEKNASSVLSLSSPNRYVAEHLEKHFKKNLLNSAKSFSPDITDIVFCVYDPSSSLKETSFPSSSISSPMLHLNKRFTLDSFVVGPNSQFAHSAATAVSKAPGKTKFNPLHIYGGVGLGKTHLLQAIGNFILNKNHDCNVIYSTSEEFYLSFIDAIKNNSIKTFSSQFKEADVLLIDDIQFFSGKESSQEEFFHIFNEIHKNEKQIVLTSDVPPQDILGLQERLISRFQWGLSVDIQPPNLETRVAILKKKAEEDNLSIPENIIYFIAENVSSNIRELEGVIIKLLAYASITKSDITIDLVRSVLKESNKIKKIKISPDEVIASVGEYYKIPVNKIREKDRRKEVAHCRQIGMYIAKLVTNSSLKTIGLHFGGRNHSTVIHAINNIEIMKKKDISLSNEIEYIINILIS